VPATQAASPDAPPSLAASTARSSFDPSDVTAPFTPLRVEPPPRIYATWWLRYLLLLTQLVGIVVVLSAEYVQPGRLSHSSSVVTTYALAAGLLVCWSALAMTDASRLVPATAYHRSSSALVAVVLWVGAFAAPLGVFRAVAWARDRFADNPDDAAVVVATTFAVLVAFLLVWLPFHYHTGQAQRIGAPQRVVAGWFWLPIVATVGVVMVSALGLNDSLSQDGWTPGERTLHLAVVFGAPALVFALSTWRATTVFDEVIDLRWRRWRKDWEQTLAAMAAQPPPGPEAPARLPDA
jgi:hypothetical protein